MLICELTESWETEKQKKQNVTIFYQKKNLEFCFRVIYRGEKYHKNIINQKLKLLNKIYRKIKQNGLQLEAKFALG